MIISAAGFLFFYFSHIIVKYQNIFCAAGFNKNFIERIVSARFIQENENVQINYLNCGVIM